MIHIQGIRPMPFMKTNICDLVGLKNDRGRKKWTFGAKTCSLTGGENQNQRENLIESVWKRWPEADLGALKVFLSSGLPFFSVEQTALG